MTDEGRKKGAEFVLNAGEELEENNWPHELICARLAKDLKDYYSDEHIRRIAKEEGHEDWVRAYDAKSQERLEQFQHMLETLTKNVVYVLLADSENAVSDFASCIRAERTFLENPTVKPEIKEEICRKLGNDSRSLDRIRNIIIELRTALDMIAISQDQRLDLPALEKGLVLTANLSKSFRWLSTVFEKSTKWISRIVRLDVKIEPIRCPACFVDLVKEVVRIRSSERLKDAYNAKCDELDKLEGIATTTVIEA